MSKETLSSGNISLKDLIDIPTFQRLSDHFAQLTGFTVAFLDRNGDILITSGWQQVCSDYHRIHPVTTARCIESDTVLASQANKKKHNNYYTCKNGLVDLAVPIIIDNTHMGNLFAGQFFLEPPDMDFFVKQAQEFGFDQEKYLAAIARVPVISLDKVQQTLSFLENLTVIIGENSLSHKKLSELNEQLEQRVRERTAELAVSNERFRSLSEAAFEGIIISKNGTIIEVNNTLCEMTGYQESELVNNTVYTFIHPQDAENVRNKISTDYEKQYEIHCKRKDGSLFPAEIQAKKFTYKGETVRVAAIRDITERKLAEEEIRQLRGILPICSFCKKIRDDKGYWEQVEVYINRHSQADFSHGICPDCMKQHFPDFNINLPKRHDRA